MDQRYLQALEQEAYDLSSFDDSLLDGYAGQLLDGFGFQGSGVNLIEEATRQNRLFGLTITNSNAQAESFYLCPGYLDSTVNGHPVSGKSIEGNALTFSGSQSLAQFYSFIKRNPLAIVGLRFSSADNSNVVQTLAVQRFNDPFVQPQLDNIVLAARQNEYVQQLGVVTADVAIVFDDQTTIKVTVAKGSTLTITCFAGKALNTGQAMQRIVQAGGAIQPSTPPMPVQTIVKPAPNANVRDINSLSYNKWLRKK
jgi:hypothetical protein